MEQTSLDNGKFRQNKCHSRKKERSWQNNWHNVDSSDSCCLV